jgi:hypothetical protein
MFKRRAKSALVRHSIEAGNLGHQSSVSGQQDASIKVIREAGAPASDAPAEAYLLPVRTRSCVWSVLEFGIACFLLLSWRYEYATELS